MLQGLRDNAKSAVSGLLVGFLVLIFAVSGLEGFSRLSDTSGDAALVNGDAISERDLNRAIAMQKQQLQERYGNNLPPEFISDERMRQPALNGLVTRQLLVQAAKAQGLAISQAELDKLLLEAPQFQVDGQFNPDRFRQLLMNMGYTPSTYSTMLEQEITTNQLRTGLGLSSFSLEQEVSARAALAKQTRSFDFITLSQADTLSSVEVSDEELSAHYDNNSGDYMQAEQVAIEYVRLSPAILEPTVEVSEQELEAQYQQFVAAFESTIERQAAHILIEASDTQAAVVEQVKTALAEGKDFSELAAEFSDDFASRDMGGDLGFTDGTAFPDSFEAALAKLEVGQVSEPVETDSGIHIIKLLAQTGSDQAPAFAEQKAELESALKIAKAQSAFAEQLELLAELAYNAENLKEVADQLALTLEETELFSRNSTSGFTANAVVTEAAFSDGVLKEGFTSEVLELGSDEVAVLRLTEHKPVHVKPFDSVKEQVIADLKAQKAAEQLSAEGQKLLSAMASSKVEELAKDDKLTWQAIVASDRSNPQVDAELLRAVFAMPKPADAPVTELVTAASGDVWVVSLSAVMAGTTEQLTGAEKQGLSAQISQGAGQGDFNAYQSSLSETAEVEIY